MPATPAICTAISRWKPGQAHRAPAQAAARTRRIAEKRRRPPLAQRRAGPTNSELLQLTAATAPSTASGHRAHDGFHAEARPGRASPEVTMPAGLQHHDCQHHLPQAQAPSPAPNTLCSTTGHCLLLDCGLFQGYKQLRLRNWQRRFRIATQIPCRGADARPPGPQRLSAAAGGTATPAIHWATRAPATCAPSRCPDSGYPAGRGRRLPQLAPALATCAPALPHHIRQDALRCMKQFRTPFTNVLTPLRAGTHIQPYRCILGAASVLLEAGAGGILFSGIWGARRPDGRTRRTPPAGRHRCWSSPPTATASTRTRTCWKNCALPCSAWLHGAAWRWYRCLPSGPCAIGAACHRPPQEAGDPGIVAGVSWTAHGRQHHRPVRNAAQTGTASRTRKCMPSRTAPPWCRPPRRVQALAPPRVHGDSVGQRHDHGQARAAPPGAVRGRPPQHGRPHRPQAPAPAARIAGAKVHPHPWPGDQHPRRGGATDQRLGPCRRRANPGLDARHSHTPSRSLWCMAKCRLPTSCASALRTNCTGTPRCPSMAARSMCKPTRYRCYINMSY